MNSEVEILAFLKKDQQTDALFKNIDNVIYFEDKNKFLDRLNIQNPIYPRLAIIDIKYILDKNHQNHLDISNDLMYKNASIVVYGKNINSKIANRLYDLNIKGIIDQSKSDTHKIFSSIKRRTNLYASTFKNNSIKAVIEYNELGNISKKITYLLDYVIEKYHISNIDAADIRLALIYLFVAFKQNKIVQIQTLIKTIYKSNHINQLYQNYKKPKSFNEKILVILLNFYANSEISSYVKNSHISSIEPELVQEIQQICDDKTISVISYQDINFFWDRLYISLVETYSDDIIPMIDSMLTNTFKALEYFLIHSNYLLVSSNLSHPKQIKIECEFTADIDLIKNYLADFSNFIDISINQDNSLKVSILYNLDNTSVLDHNQVCNNTNTTPHQSLTIDTSNINSMHYEDHQKISAYEFSQDFTVDQDMLADLKDSKKDIEDMLYKEELISQNTLNAIASILQKYSVILHETVEFEDVASSLSALANFFTTISIDTIEDSKRQTLSFYVQGLIDDLSNWKNHIFVDKNTPDIHYLDASLLENCATIEKFIHSTPAEGSIDDDDDLEFF